MKTSGESVETPDNDRLFGLASLAPRHTGLPFTVWVSPRLGASYPARVHVSKGVNVHPADLIAVSMRPDVRVLSGGEMGAHELTVLERWIGLNEDVLIQYWNGDIEDAPDVIAALEPLSWE